MTLNDNVNKLSIIIKENKTGFYDDQSFCVIIHVSELEDVKILLIARVRI